MTDFYCDISAIGNEYQSYADTPATWGTPQDGNGLAGPGHSAAVAIGTIDCFPSGVPASASGAGGLGVLGVTVSSTLTGSGSTLATNIVTAVNATATPTGATYSALLLPLNKLVFARVNPGVNTEVQIMLRIAGVDWNGMTHTTSGTWGTTPTMGAFSGGANGPFAYLANDTTVFGKTLLTYGSWFAAPASVLAPAEFDVINVRTGRGGVGLSMAINTSGAVTAAWRAGLWLYDGGAVWTGASTTLTCNLNTTHPGTSTVGFSLPTTKSVNHISQNKYNFHMKVTQVGVGGTTQPFTPPSNGTFKYAFVRCKFEETVSSVATVRMTNISAATVTLAANLSESMVSRVSVNPMIFFQAATTPINVNLNGMVFEQQAASASIAPFLTATSAGIAVSGKITWIGGRVYDSNGVFTCPTPFSIATIVPNLEVTCDGVVGVTDPSFGFTSVSINSLSKLIWSSLQGPVRGFRYEVPSFTVDWKGDGTFPHCGAVSLQGDSWSHRVTWRNLNGIGMPVTVLRLSYFYRGSAATKTVTLELYVPDAYTLYTDELIFAVSYLDSSDVWNVEGSSTALGLQFAASGRTALASSAKTWTPSGVPNHSAKKLTLTTIQPIKQNTELLITLSLAAGKSPAITFFASPEVGVA